MNRSHSGRMEARELFPRDSITGGNMTISTAKLKAAISFALALVVASVFTLTSFAASKRSEWPPGKNSVAPVGKNSLDGPTGKLIGTGRLTIDGEEAPSGTTVLSGSTIATGPDGNATIDLGSLGRIELRPNTTITLVLSSNSVQVDMGREGTLAQWLPLGVEGQVRTRSEQVRFSVTRGQVEVKSARSTRNLSAGEAGTFNDPAEAVASGDAMLVAECGATNDKAGATSTASPSGGTISAGPVGVAILVGVAGAVALGVMAGRNDNRKTTLPKPSTIVP